MIKYVTLNSSHSLSHATAGYFNPTVGLHSEIFVPSTPFTVANWRCSYSMYDEMLSDVVCLPLFRPHHARRQCLLAYSGLLWKPYKDDSRTLL